MLAQRNALVWLMVSVFVCSVSTPCQPKFTCQTKFTQTSRVGNAPCLCGTWHLAPLTTRFPLLWARCVGAQVGSVSLCSRSHQYGRVKDVRLAKDKRGKGRGFGYVEFEDEVGGFPASVADCVVANYVEQAGATKALMFNGQELRGRPVHVAKSQPKPSRRGAEYGMRWGNSIARVSLITACADHQETRKAQSSPHVCCLCAMFTRKLRKTSCEQRLNRYPCLLCVCGCGRCT